MQVEPQVAFEGFEPDDRVRDRVASEIGKLEGYFEHITSCRVVVKLGSGRRQHGDLYEVTIQLALPSGRDVIVNRNPSANHAHEDVLVTIRDAFRAARRQMQDEVKKMRGDVKQSV
ncbi:MAG: ribosome-associated translation inhibitor RaiA [Alphaproteobacteria bacterium]|nr:ribosome-associated translation inhibitor RaiA [Alphaproteobacteria bacterium]MCB9930486.1 ribosome-associated translation inhibitor RaiA [Alphaproteobacteria bacterium]